MTTNKRTQKKFGVHSNKKAYKMTINKKSFLLLIVFSVSFLVLAGNLFRIIFMENRDYDDTIKERQVNFSAKSTKYIEAKRGTITDRNGVILAYSEKNFRLILDPYNLNLKDDEVKNRMIDYIAGHFAIEKSEIIKVLDESKDLKYKVLKTDLTMTTLGDAYHEIESGKSGEDRLVCLTLEPYYKRIYKEGAFASSLLGFANNDGGLWGVESYYNDYLAGIPGREYGVLNEGFYAKSEVVEAIDGGTLVLTIDYNLQKYVEDTIKTFLIEHDYGCDGIDVILMDPETSEVLAMASYPTFDPNQPAVLDDEWISKINDFELMDQTTLRNSIWKNHIISNGYEPGSTFKPFTLSAALEMEAIDEHTEFYCDGAHTVAGRVIHCWKPEGHGTQNYIEALANSCNPAFMQMGEKMDNIALLDYYKSFGFGTKTGIDLLGEEAGILFDSESFNTTEKATTAFGQGINVTQIQLINNFSALVNGGNLKKPSVMKKILDPQQGIILSNKDLTIRKVVSYDTSIKIRNALGNVVINGTAAKAKVEGYTIGGKTGTAQKLPRDVENPEFIISFIGFSPVESPKIVASIAIDNFYGVPAATSSFAADMFSDIMTKAIPYFETKKK